ncbi:MAG: FliM/FliN family flagellar motor switch protein [Acidobacteriaceae bacterium]
MQSFLTAWLTAASPILERELSGKLGLLPSARLPQPESALAVSITPGGALSGRFLAAADRAALHALFVEARVTDSGEDPVRDAELWRGLLEQIASAAALNFAPGIPVSISLDEAAWTLGVPAAAYELHFGNAVLPLAFTDEIRISEPAGGVSGQASPASPSHASRQVAGPATSAKVAPGGIDLLLDVELETSLRFGSREMPLNEVLDLGAGDVVELDRYISDPVDLLVGDKIVARGEVVLVNGTFGMRVLEVAEPRKCLESIRCLF